MKANHLINSENDKRFFAACIIAGAINPSLPAQDIAKRAFEVADWLIIEEDKRYIAEVDFEEPENETV
jgi:hypothetical protein